MSYPAVIVKFMFDTDRSSSIFVFALPSADVAASPAGPAQVPLERLEAQICELADARTREEREQGGDPAGRGRVTVYEPQDCDELVRQYLEQAPRGTGPTLIPIQV
jgi:hypothetical protein